MSYIERQKMDYTIPYYVWLLSKTAHNYFEVEKIYSLALHLENTTIDEKWLFDAAKYLASTKKMNPRKSKEARKNARILGRAGEQTVCNYLQNNGWTIIDFTPQELYPKYGTSPTLYDICAKFDNNKERFIEIKSSDDCPFFIIYFKQKIKIDQKLNKIPNHFHVFVRGNKMFYVRTADIKYSGYIKNINNPKLNYYWVVDPACLKSFN